MEFSTTSSFTPLSTIHLPTSHVLHPDACNPAMDLVVVFSTSSSGVAPPKPAIYGAKGKGKAESVGVMKSKVELWRMSGSKSWEVELKGKVGGLAWTLDGLHLSVLLLSHDGSDSVITSPNTARVEHLSVHSGSAIHTVLFDEGIRAMTNEDWYDLDSGYRWWKLEWRSSGLEWQKPRDGSSLLIIDSLPGVTPVDPPKPANTLPFMLQAASATASTSTPTAHPKLSSFPSLLPSAPNVGPEILGLTSPRSTARRKLLTGTFPLRAEQIDRQILALAQISDRMSSLLEVVVRGLEAAEQAFRDGEKQTMIWREEVEVCAEQQSMSKADVHADLFRLLMTGRNGPAVGEWLGNRLTGRTITKWELALDSSFSTIRKVITESIGPAIERVMLLLEELHGWALAKTKPDQALQLDADSIKSTLKIAAGFATLMEQMRQDADQEMQAAAEFLKWLKYEISRAAAADPSHDTLPTAMHDIKFVWSFLQGGFVASPLRKHFPALASRDPPEDLSPDTHLSKAEQSVRPLSVILSETLSTLSGKRKPEQHQAPTEDFASPPQPDESINSSLAFSPDRDRDDTPRIISSPPDSPASLDEGGEKDADAAVERDLIAEPWVWANTLLEKCRKIVVDAVGHDKGKDSEGRGLDPGGGALYTERVVGEEDVWVAFVPEESLLLAIRPRLSVQIGAAITFQLEHACCLAIQFFDDVELALLLETRDGQRYLVTVDYAVLELEPVTERLTEGEWSLSDLVHAIKPHGPLPIHRCRALAAPSTRPIDIKERITLALNGRKGRRVGCVSMGDGREVEVLDMEEDEDAEEEEGDGDGEESMEA